MKLSEKQAIFTRALTLLISYANYIGYEITLGDVFRDERCSYGHPQSTHRFRLAADLNVFKGGEYLKGIESKDAHNELHDFADMLGMSERIGADLNHYSFEHRGVR